MTAWKEGCKGITVYCDGCREGVLTSINQKSTEFKQHDAPKRPKELECNLHEVKIKGESYTVLVGLYDNRPYEIFALNFHIEDKLKEEELQRIKFEKPFYIVKNKSRSYDLYESNKIFSLNITEDLTDEEATITRLVSTALRHGADIKFIVEQLNKTQGDLTNFGKAIARTLSKYIKKEEKLKCPECNQSTLIKEAGCEKCINCSYSKCS